MMTLGASITKETMFSESCWQLTESINCFADPTKEELVTQASPGRFFRCIKGLEMDSDTNRSNFQLEICLLEDGYKCWVDMREIIHSAIARESWEPILLSADQIQNRIPEVLRWLEKAALKENKYLWGGTIGPDFDCSGLVQAAFSSQQIWLPRDAYQQEQFCESLELSLENFKLLKIGDLLFFGSPQKCTHVAIYLGQGMYCHSSGIINGNNGIGLNGLCDISDNSVAYYYQSHLRGAGRVVQCHDGRTLA